jgi:hypothetical protein
MMKIFQHSLLLGLLFSMGCDMSVLDSNKDESDKETQSSAQRSNDEPSLLLGNTSIEETKNQSLLSMSHPRTVMPVLMLIAL